MLYATTLPSPVGTMTLACDGERLTGLWLEGQKYHGGTGMETLVNNPTLPIFAAARQWLDEYFAGSRPAIARLPLAPRGSAFRQGVWDILCQIPYGQVVTYGSIARQMAERLGRDTMSSQAVGGAVGHNPLSIIVPCHRVVGAHGSLTGYAGGIDIKIKLLEHEGVDLTSYFVPTKGTAL